MLCNNQCIHLLSFLVISRAHLVRDISGDGLQLTEELVPNLGVIIVKVISANKNGDLKLCNTNCLKNITRNRLHGRPDHIVRSECQSEDGLMTSHYRSRGRQLQQSGRAIGVRQGKFGRKGGPTIHVQSQRDILNRLCTMR